MVFVTFKLHNRCVAISNNVINSSLLTFVLYQNILLSMKANIQDKRTITVHRLTFVFWFSSIRFTSKKCLMILSGEVHIVISQGIFAGGPKQALIFRATKKTVRISPDFAFWKSKLNSEFRII